MNLPKILEALKPYLPEFLVHLIERVVAPMPVLFRVVFYVAISLCLIAVLHTKLVEIGIPIPEWLGKINIVAAAVAAILSKLTVNWKAWEEIKKKAL